MGARRVHASMPQSSSKPERSVLTPRLRRQMEAISTELGLSRLTDQYLRGMLWGLNLGMKAMYPDADSFVGQEPTATQLILTYRAVEEALDGAN